VNGKIKYTIQRLKLESNDTIPYFYARPIAALGHGVIHVVKFTNRTLISPWNTLGNSHIKTLLNSNPLMPWNNRLVMAYAANVLMGSLAYFPHSIF
jgi:hypothetical protein